VTPLATARLRIRELAAADAPFMLALLNEPSFIANIGDRGVRTLDDARGYLDRGPLSSYRRHGFGLYLVELGADGTPIGICGILRREELPNPDLGFAFLPAYWKQGYAYESATAIRRHARETLGIRRLLAIVNPANAPSIRLLERLGFRFESTTRRGNEDRPVNLYVDEET
jgi:ribosomal-protein-alanine N-acetyltransferase